MRQSLFLLRGNALVVVLLCMLGISAPSVAQPERNALPSLAPMLEEVTPAVVNISTSRSPRMQGPSRSFSERDLRRFFEEGLTPPQINARPMRTAGSGVIVDAENGYVVTNHHVVNGADSITVSLIDDRQFQASLIGSDAQTDVALLQIEAEDLVDLPFADVSQLRVGDYVVAIGNPFGIGQTVTSGIVSALGRAGLNADNYEDFIQTDAAINMGNSGGALVDLAGNLVGINTAIISGSGTSAGVGFAVPADMVAAVMEHLERDGTVRRGQLGVQIRDYTPILEQAVGAGTERGALVMGVMPGSAAEQVGIQVSDVIVAVNGRQVDSGRELRNIVGLSRPESEVELVVYRSGERLTLRTTLDGSTDALADSDSAAADDARRPDDASFRGARLEAQASGLAVVNVQPQSPAWNAGLRPGDVITEVNRRQVSDLREFNQEINDSDNLTALGVLREGRPLLIIIS